MASIAIHLCIGSVYAWSIFNPPLMKLKGVVASAADDWTLSQVTWIFTVAIVILGLAAAVAGKWLERVGPRMVGVVSACCWGGGFLVGGLGILTHQLWLLYVGYGVIGGCGLGLGYVSPVSTLIKWFPDRRGMATGLAIMGFGGGAIIGAPLKEALIKCFYEAPRYLGTMLVFTMYGGGFATIPAYLSDLFGTRFVGGIHGRLLTAWSTAGVLGPVAITHLRDRSLRAALVDLAGKVNPATFEQTFGAPVSELATLIHEKTITLPKLMALAPPGTVDPSSTLYSSTMLAMAGLLVIAFFANAMIRPVDSLHHHRDEE